MNARAAWSCARGERGVGLMEVMISIVIGMLLVLVIYQVYEISESQKRTITAGSDAQQNASYGLFMCSGRDISMAGNGIASTAVSSRPVRDAASDSRPDRRPARATTIPTRSPCSTAVRARWRRRFRSGHAATSAQPYVVAGPGGLQRASTDDADRSDRGGQGRTSARCRDCQPAESAVSPQPPAIATISHTPHRRQHGRNVHSAPRCSSIWARRRRWGASHTRSTRPATCCARRTCCRPPRLVSPSPVINDVVNLKAQYGVDANCDGVLTSGGMPTGPWSFANVQALPLLPLRSCALRACLRCGRSRPCASRSSRAARNSKRRS